MEASKKTINWIGKEVSVDIQSLIDLGWELSDLDDQESKETYHINIRVKENGYTEWFLTNTRKAEGGIWEGSDSEHTGDDEQTIKDLDMLYIQGKLWNII